VNDSPRRSSTLWPLRTALLFALTVFVVVSVVFYQLQRESEAATTRGSSSTTTTVGRHTGSTTTTTAERNSGSTSAIPKTPVTAKGGPTSPARGCNFALAAPKGSTKITPTRAIGHCTVLEIGDSLGNDLGWGLARVLVDNPGLHLVQMDLSDTGLVDTGFYNWFTALPTYLKKYHPNMVLICIGGNDEQNLSVNGQDLQFPTPAWKKAYEQRVKQIADMAHRSGALVVWVGMPVMAPYFYNQGMLVLNAQYVKGATSVPGGTFVPSWDLLATSSGEFQQGARVNHHWQTLRSSDGIHFSYVGEQVFATYVARQIGAVFHVHLRLTGAATIDG
jgi:uncharacterized protein